MAFFDRFKKWYLVKVRCYNCGHTQDCKVPKGMTIDSHLKTEAAQCENCGNPTLRRIEMVRVPPAVRGPLKEPQLPELPPLRRPVRPMPRQQPSVVPRRPMLSQRPRPRPRPRPPVRQDYDDMSNEVEYPVDRPVATQEEEGRPGFERPEWTPKPKKINFWTGREDF